MAVEFEKLKFTRDWNNSSDFPTYEENEQKVRADMQALHDETKEFINETLIPGIENMAVPGTGDMKTEFYDPENKRTNIYQYAEDKIAEHLEGENHVDAYSKEESMSAETRETLGLAENATPDDALNALETKVSAAGSQVGDIKITVRTDLGDDWLLCNGVKVSREVYEALGEQIPVNLAAEWTAGNLWSDSSAKTYITSIAYVGGYWIAGGTVPDGSSGSKARIAYTADLAGPWTIKDIWGGGYTDLRVDCVAYANGYWVVGGQNRSGSTRYATIAYTTDLTSEWTVKNAWSGGDSDTSVKGLVYANGYWVACGDVYSSGWKARIAYTTDLAGTWTTNNIWVSGAINSINGIVYTNGYWVAYGRSLSGSTYTAKIAYTKDHAGTWTVKDLWTGNNNSVYGVAYGDGCWVLGGLYYDGTTYFARIARAENLDGDWTTVDLWSGSKADNRINSVAYADGVWVVGGLYYPSSGWYARIAYTEDPAGDWNIVELWNGTSSTINVVTYANGVWTVGGLYFNNSVYYARVDHLDTKVIPLPEISVDGSYAYIKAKE